MEADFSKPQRQSLIGIVVLFVDYLQFLKALFVVFILQFVKKGDLNINYVWILVLILSLSLLSYLSYLNFTFHIDNDSNEFIVNKGIFSKTKTIIQLHKIQQVNISQSLIQRIIGVYALDIDTAGTDKKESSIRAISQDLAIALKAKLLENDIEKDNNEIVLEKKQIDSSEETPFLKIDLLSLLKIGITSNYVKTIGLIWVFYFTVLEDLKHIGFEYVPDDSQIEPFFKNNTIFYIVVILALMSVSGIFIINIGRTLIKFFNYTITKQKGSLVLFYGLLATKSTILKPEKVQIVIVSRNYFQKKLNVLSLKIKQTVGSLDAKNKNIIEIPGCNSLEKDEILKLLFKQLPEKGAMMKPNFRKLGFAVFLKIILPLTAYVIFGKYIDNVVFDYVHFAIGFAVFVMIILFFSFKNYRLFINDNHIIKQNGAWDIDTEIIQIDKIQALTTSQLFWHKRLNIGSLIIHTSGGNVTFHLGNFDEIKQYVNLWLYKLETSNNNWM